jgi:HPr kinase/phosphorylase
LEKKYNVKLSQVVAEHSLGVAYAAPDFDEKRIFSADLNRPGIQLLGHLEYFDTDRLQVVGKAEMALLDEMVPERRRAAYEVVLGHQVPGLIIAHDQPVHPECLEMAKKYGVSVMTTEVDTSEFYAQLIGTLRRHLAPRGTIHGVLVEVHGEGMLIIGDSGIGKSETALELIKRGHRLIADDAVEILRTSRTSLEGRSPAIIQYFMELRGIGVVNVQNVFGIGAVKPSCPIDLVVAMELWDETRCYDRLGLDTETWEYLGISVPRVTIPVRPGRNLAVILELAAMTNRQKKLGYNAAEELAQRIDAQVDSGIDF